VRGDVPVDSEMFLMTDFVNFKIKPTQSFGGDYRDSVCVCVFIGVSACTCMSPPMSSSSLQCSRVTVYVKIWRQPVKSENVVQGKY
jgi:hypothetical protein